MNKTLQLLLLSATIGLSFTGSSHREVVFLCDFSQSTVEAEEYVNSVLGRSFSTAPGGTRYHVIPMHMNTRNSAVIASGDIPNSSSATELNEKRVQSAQGVLKAMEKARLDKGPHRQKSCIVDALARLSSFVSDAERASTQLIAVFVTDMVEDCGPLPSVRGKAAADVLLTQRYGKNYRTIVGLNSTRVIVCPPASSSAGTSADRSGIGVWEAADQREFWIAVFERAGLKSAPAIKGAGVVSACTDELWR